MCTWEAEKERKEKRWDKRSKSSVPPQWKPRHFSSLNRPWFEWAFMERIITLGYYNYLINIFVFVPSRSECYTSCLRVVRRTCLSLQQDKIDWNKLTLDLFCFIIQPNSCRVPNVGIHDITSSCPQIKRVSQSWLN